ncbi:TMEM43 family protein [Luteolibacter marinus]|uniref:TMEM43 family protein n=1 Tax=Luteolibacter marinus TaxID=2776705 RepID=UPI001868147D|nr:TMEM43 family protein [Luteolibacter marinus]
MAERKKKKGNGILFGLAMIGLSIGALWKNEHRYDYYKAARDTEPVESVDRLARDTLFSHSGAMDQGLTLEGVYVTTFQGYLEVDRVAEVYAWDRDEDDDGVRWSKKWMSYLQNNERNRGLEKKFKSGTIAPPAYRVADLRVEADEIQFVDPARPIPPSGLTLTRLGTEQGLVLQEDHFYLAKGHPEQLGDERVSYRGIPVPETATYFGKWSGGAGVAHQAEVEKGFIAGVIQDKGILHHLVAGSRETALASIGKHLARLKMIVRIVGLAVCTLGGGILFASLTRLLVFLPFFGPFLNRVTGWLGMIFGFSLGLLTLAIAFVTSQPWILGGIAAVVAVAGTFLGRNAARKRRRIQRNVASTLGHVPSPEELKELEFIQLWLLASGNGAINPDEQAHLDRLIRRNAWTPGKVSELTQRAERERAATSDREKLEALVRYSLADGRIDRKELKNLQSAAAWIGVDRKDLRALMTRVQSV